MNESQADPRIGIILQDRYRVLERIAAGGMGVVYRGERLQLGRAVAIKFMHSWVVEQPSVLARFEVEAKAMSRLQHPACVSVIDFGVHERAPYLVMDYVTGETLSSVLDRSKRLPAEQALDVVRQLLAGLAHAHASGIIHRDIKPDNIVLTDLGGFGDHVRILDFGLAKLLREAGSNLSTGLAVGTPSYMAPEQTCGDPVDERSDIYSVGVLLFQLLTGRKPFESDRAIEIMAMQREAKPPSLRSLVPELSQALDDVVQKALAKKPGRRFATAVELAAALGATPEGSGDASARTSVATGRARPADGAALSTSDTIDVRAATVAVARQAAAAIAARRRRLPLLTRLSSRRLKALIAGVAGLMLAGALGARACRSPAHREAATESSRPTPRPPRPTPAVIGVTEENIPGMDEVQTLIRARRVEAAIGQIRILSKRYPGNAYLPYLEGTLCMTQLFWSEGLDAYGRALTLYPAYAKNPELIRNVVRALVNDRQYHRAAQVLADQCGAAAIPILKEAKERDDSLRVRQRAAALLEKLDRAH